MKTYKTISQPFTVVISVEFLLSFYTKPSLQVLWQYSPWKTLSLDPSPWMKPIALTLLSLGPGPQGTSPDNCLPGTFTSCALSAPPQQLPAWGPTPLQVLVQFWQHNKWCGTLLCSNLFRWWRVHLAYVKVVMMRRHVVLHKRLNWRLFNDNYVEWFN